MYILPDNIYPILVLIIIQGGLVLLVLYFFIDRLLNARKIQHERELIKNQAFAEATALLEKARKEALDLVGNVHTVIEEYTTQAKTTFENMESKVQNRITRAIDSEHTQITTILKDFGEKALTAAEQTQNDTLAEYREIFSDIKRNFKQSADQYTDIISQKTSAYEAELKENMTHRLSDMDKRLQEYETARAKMYKDVVFTLVQGIALDIFGHSMTMADQEDYVIKIIEKAGFSSLIRENKS